MSMFDKVENFTDHFREGETFTLQAAWTEKRNTAEYGEGIMAVLKIDGKSYGLWGAGVVSQIQRQKSGDLPAEVSVQRGKNKAGQDLKLLVPAGQQVPAADDIPF